MSFNETSSVETLIKFAATYRQIMVTVNYRLGIFGYMSYFDQKPTGGNYGLLDQQMAIDFIKENALNLNGDPNRITIFGESSGGSSRLT